MQIVPSGGHSTERLGVWPLAMKCADPQAAAWDMAGISITALVELGSGGTAGPNIGLHASGTLVEWWSRWVGGARARWVWAGTWLPSWLPCRQGPATAAGDHQSLHCHSVLDEKSLKYFLRMCRTWLNILKTF